MYVDVELFLVTLVGLILRIDIADLSSDPLPLGLQTLFPDSCGWLCTGTLYGDLLWVLLLLTLLPALVAVIHRSPEEKAQALLYAVAGADARDTSSDLAKRRKALLDSRTSPLEDHPSAQADQETSLNPLGADAGTGREPRGTAPKATTGDENSGVATVNAGVAAGRVDADLPVTELVDRFYAELESQGHSRWDTSSLIALLDRPGSVTEETS